jgi:hypothetical protein
MTEIKGKPLQWQEVGKDNFSALALGFSAGVMRTVDGKWLMACNVASISRHLTEEEAKLRAQDVYDALIQQAAVTDTRLEAAQLERLTADVTHAEIDAAMKATPLEESSAKFNDTPLYIARVVKHIWKSRVEGVLVRAVVEVDHG